jgi:hypothetical protein
MARVISESSSSPSAPAIFFPVELTGGHMPRRNPVQPHDPPNDREPVRGAPRDPKALAEELARKSPEALAELQRLVALERLVAEMSG